MAGPITSLKAYQLRVINAEGVRLWFSQAPTDRYGRPMPPNEWEETITATYDSNVDPLANQPRSAQLLTIFHQAGNLAMGVHPNPGPIETGDDTIEVNGARAHPLYEFLKREKPGLLGSEAIKWNFTKFLIDRSGQVASRHAPTTAPQALARGIEALL